MRPPLPAATMRRAAAWAQVKAPSRSMVSTWRHSSSDSSRNGVALPVPALFTNTSSPPIASASSSTTSAPRDGSVRSRWRTSARWPVAFTSAAVWRAPGSSVFQVTPTSQPASARATAVARPIPESLPVTIATPVPFAVRLPWRVALTRWPAVVLGGGGHVHQPLSPTAASTARAARATAAP